MFTGIRGYFTIPRLKKFVKSKFRATLNVLNTAPLGVYAFTIQVRIYQIRIYQVRIYIVRILSYIISLTRDRVFLIQNETRQRNTILVKIIQSNCCLVLEFHAL